MSSALPSFQKMAEVSPLPMVIWDESGTIYEANEAFFQLLGMTAGVPLSVNYWDLTPALQKQLEINHLLSREHEPYEKELCLPNGKLRSVRVDGFTLDRRQQRTWFAAIMRPLRRPTGIYGDLGASTASDDSLAAVSSVATDDQAERERVLRRQNELLFRLARSPIVSSGDFVAAARDITEVAARGLQVSRASIWVFDQHRRRIVCQMLYELETGRHNDRAVGMTLMAGDFPAYFRALSEDRAVVADDALTHPATFEFRENYLEPLGIHSMLEAPLRHKGELVGVLCHEHCHARRSWTHDDINFAGHLADLVERAMEAVDRSVVERALHQLNSELEQRIDDRARQLEEATELVLRLQKERTEAQMAAGFAQEMQSALNSASTVIGKVLGRGDASEADGDESAMQLRSQLQELYAKLSDRLDEATTEEFGLAMQHADVLTESFSALLRPVEQALKITREISEYSLIGRARPGHELCPMIPLIQSIYDELQPLIEQNQIRIVFDLHGPLHLYGVELHYRAAIRNLLVNACDALAELPDDRPRRIFLRYHSVPAGALISVEDNGDGIPDQMRQRLFEPFFSTKGRSHTGLGLPIVRKVATLYDGQLDIDSRPGEGTRARILLPLKQVAPVR